MIDKLLAFVAPHSCCGCGEVGSELCEGCRYNIISEGFAGCVGCLRPTRGDNLCANCTDLKAEAVWCVGLRQAELKALLDTYKFTSVRSASRPLAQLLDAVLPPLPEGIVVTVVPSASAHSRERGFDHLERIGRELAELRGVPFLPLLRRKTGGTQHFKTKKERLDAAREAYELLATRVPDKVLLVDDILTTGATMRVALNLLSDAGVETLYGAIIARQPLDESSDLW